MNIIKSLIYFTSIILLFNNSNYSSIYLPYYNYNNDDNNYVKFYQLLM